MHTTTKNQHAADEAQTGTMRAITQDIYGTTETWQLTTIPKPEIQPDEVLLRVHAAGLDRGTWHMMTGRPYLMRVMGFGLRRPKNRVPGRATAGTVVEVGSDVTRFAVGDQVYGVSTGGYAEYAAARSDKLVHMPSNLTFDQAAAVPISATTAMQAIQRAGVEAGQTVLILGASGGVGSYAVQIANALGAHVTGVSSTAKVDLVHSLGADHVIDYTANERITQRHDVVLDIGGNTPLRQLRRMLTADGTLVIVGGESKGDWTGGFGRSLRAPAWSLVLRQRLTMLTSSERYPSLEAVSELIADGKVTPAVDQVFRLDEAQDAMRLMEAGNVRGKVVVAI